ncbi:hypothetical protein HKX48_006391 [Thoreauomyces humboldtii]|nr:hypothetical protein HKX48_006391 [Thoreauomyces humboldtii]
MTGLYKSISGFPTFLSAQVFPDKEDKASARLLVEASVRDLHLNKRRRIATEVGISQGGSVAVQGFTSESEAAGLIAQFADGRWVRQRTVEEKDKKRRFIEVWKSGLVVSSIEVTDVHGEFYSDDTFGSIRLSFSEKKLVYVAERKEADAKTWEKFVYKPDWGEKFAKRAAPSIVVADLDTEEVLVLPHQENLALGQVQFGPDDETLIFWGLKTFPRQYGILFCPNRVSGIYQTDLEGGNLTQLSSPNVAARSPRLDATSRTLFWLENDTGGPHFTCARLMARSLKDGAIRVVLPEVKKAELNGFPGLFTDRLPTSCVAGSGDAQWIFSSTTWRSRKSIIAINVKSGAVMDLAPTKETGSWSFLALNGDWIVGTRSAPETPHAVYIGKLQLSSDAARAEFHVAHAPSDAPVAIKSRTITYSERSNILEAILLTPSGDQAKTLL